MGLVWQPLGLAFVGARVALLQSFVCATCASMRGCPTARARQAQAQRSAGWRALQARRRRSCRRRTCGPLWRPRRSLSRGLARVYKTCFACFAAVGRRRVQHLKRGTDGRIAHSACGRIAANCTDSLADASLTPQQRATKHSLCAVCTSATPSTRRQARSGATNRSHGQSQEV